MNMNTKEKQRIIKKIHKTMREVIFISVMADHYTLYSTKGMSELTIYDIGNNILDVKLETHENILHYANQYLLTLKK